jgi:dTDP-glucose 4,6-dehydratase
MSASTPHYLVTGGAGFIGTNFVHYLRQLDPRAVIVVLDALTYAGERANLSALEATEHFTFVHGDIRDQNLVEDLLKRHALDTLVHFAAESHVDRSIAGPDAFIDTNILGTHALLKACRAVWLAGATPRPHRFHQISTDEVYGSLGPTDPPFRETTPYAPNSPYAASKAAADHLVRAYARTYGLSATISNCSNNYGPYQFPEKLLPLMMVNLLEGKPLPVYGDGRNVRDWLYVEDHCVGIELILRQGRPGETYNVGGGTELENLELVRRLCALADETFQAQPELRERFPHCPAARGEPCLSLQRFVTDRLGHDRRYAIDATKITRELGYRARTGLDAGLRHSFHWYANQRSSTSSDHARRNSDGTLRRSTP